jgi:DNA-binding NarL/FixJ family response regulator
MEGTSLTAGDRARSLLSEREAEIAVLLAQGRSNPEIAEKLFLSTETVKDNVGRIVRKLGATNRVEAAVAFLGLVERPPTGGR